MESTGSKNAKNCYTCRYWTGCSVRVTSANFLKYDSSEEATCNQTGFTRKAWNSCNKHEKRWDL